MYCGRVSQHVGFKVRSTDCGPLIERGCQLHQPVQIIVLNASWQTFDWGSHCLGSLILAVNVYICQYHSIDEMAKIKMSAYGRWQESPWDLTPSNVAREWGYADIMFIAVVLLFLLRQVPYGSMWRTILGLCGIWVFILFFLRRQLLETVMGSSKRDGSKRSRKRLRLCMWPPRDSASRGCVLAPTRLSGFLREIRKGRTRVQASIFAG